MLSNKQFLLVLDLHRKKRWHLARESLLGVIVCINEVENHLPDGCEEIGWVMWVTDRNMPETVYNSMVGKNMVCVYEG